MYISLDLYPKMLRFARNRAEGNFWKLLNHSDTIPHLFCLDCAAKVGNSLLSRSVSLVTGFIEIYENQIIGALSHSNWGGGMCDSHVVCPVVWPSVWPLGAESNH